MTSSDPCPSTDGHRLRSACPADAPAVLDAYRSAPDMARQGTVATLEQAREQLDWLLAEGRRAIAVVDAADSLCGLVALSIDAENRSGWFFYWLHAAHRGQGLAARAAASVADRALLPSADGGWGLERLELGHRANNPASGAVARAAGFVHEGIERGKFLLAGERVDVLTYGRLITDPSPATPGLPWQA
ncbi:GNAT family N-acetyltransferase [Brachybacterium avium]|uniref:GNAT family N-acetyltransferase n=1 Tax=Brachybacterium avium TaxID=2017485 RepID=A0A220UB88_9MICO|nr:GNAT family protein [Brachybacterium avium]ASK65206.1 GNAT family N-acetyltransferase [Brachybacterium avium]